MRIVNEEKLVRNIHAFIAKAKMATWSLIPLHSARARTPEIFYFILFYYSIFSWIMKVELNLKPELIPRIRTEPGNEPQNKFGFSKGEV